MVSLACPPSPDEGSTGRNICESVDPELFYPDSPEGERFAVGLCNLCPLRAQCLADELAFPESEQFGVRGGKTAAERVAFLTAARRGGYVPQKSYRDLLPFPLANGSAYPVGVA